MLQCATAIQTYDTMEFPRKFPFLFENLLLEIRITLKLI